MTNEPQVSHNNNAEEWRWQLLLRMYDQMFNDINRHIIVIWQSVGVLLGAFAIFALVEKNIISLDFATAVIIILSTWLLAHVYDSSYWYNRNLVIIANIERQFLVKEDLKNIHYYFGKHRKKTAMLTHLYIQWFLGLMITLAVLLYHFFLRVCPRIGEPWKQFDLIIILPYIILIICIIFLSFLRNNRIKAYEEFLENSPGKHIDTSEITYGSGHPTS